jgi:hypothetical protein
MPPKRMTRSDAKRKRDGDDKPPSPGPSGSGHALREVTPIGADLSNRSTCHLAIFGL